MVGTYNDKIVTYIPHLSVGVESALLIAVKKKTGATRMKKGPDTSSFRMLYSQASNNGLSEFYIIAIRSIDHDVGLCSESYNLVWLGRCRDDIWKAKLG